MSYLIYQPPADRGTIQAFSRKEMNLYKADMDRIIKNIEDARRCCDHVFVSIHSHEESGSSKETPAQFVMEFANKCIDAGACAVIGHGPHILRPLEIYKGRPIFYSVGNFLFQCELTACTAEDEYEKYEMTSDESVSATYEKRTAGHTRGLLSDKRMLEAVIPYIEVEDDKIIPEIVLIVVVLPAPLLPRRATSSPS